MFVVQSGGGAQQGSRVKSQDRCSSPLALHSHPAIGRTMVSSYQSLLFASSLLFFNVVAAQSGCFWANGTENPSLDYSPCTGSGLTSSCCSIRDVCLDNGLCRARNGVYYRETCTSSNWDTGACQDLCSYNVSSCELGRSVVVCRIEIECSGLTVLTGDAESQRSGCDAMRRNCKLDNMVLRRKRLLLRTR